MPTSISVYNAAVTPPSLDGTVQPDVLAGWSSSRSSQSIITQLPVRGTAPFAEDVVLRPMTRRAGTLTAIFASRDSALYLDNVGSLGGRVLYLADSDAPALNMWFIIDGNLNIDQDDDNRDIWIVTFDYRQISSPAGVTA